jgi:hypothetical protein
MRRAPSQAQLTRPYSRQRVGETILTSGTVLSIHCGTIEATEYPETTDSAPSALRVSDSAIQNPTFAGARSWAFFLREQNHLEPETAVL